MTLRSGAKAVSAGVVLSIALGMLAIDAEACSRVLWSNNGKAIVVGRNMDWLTPQPADLWVLPRGTARTGLTKQNPLVWAAKYGSIVATTKVGEEKLATSDGLNEKGLAGHLLWLAESDYGSRDASRPGLSIALWLQYYLDNFATVGEAVAFTEKTPYQLVTATIDGRKATVHLAIEDQTGDSVIIEFINGKPTIHHSRDFTVMTNSPPFDEQLNNLKKYAGFGGTENLPGSTQAADRFVRAAYYLKSLPKPKDYRECVAGVLSIMRNVAQPFGVTDPDRPNISPTRWRTVVDLTNLVYYFESSMSPNIVWVDLSKQDFSAGAPTKKLDLTNVLDRVGNCSESFKETPAFRFATPEE